VELLKRKQLQTYTQIEGRNFPQWGWWNIVLGCPERW